MPLAYFEIVNKNGTRETRLMPSEKIEFIRPLSDAEHDYAEKLRSGYFTKEILESTIPRYDPKNQAERDFHTARLLKTQVTHPDTLSILQATDGTKYCLTKPIGELAARAPNLIALTSVAPTRPRQAVEAPPPPKPTQ